MVKWTKEQRAVSALFFVSAGLFYRRYFFFPFGDKSFEFILHNGNPASHLATLQAFIILKSLRIAFVRYFLIASIVSAFSTSEDWVFTDVCVFDSFACGNVSPFRFG